jgi:F-type H+-transporting ATPase subunit delta
VRGVSRAQARHHARALLGITGQRGGDESLRLRGELRQLAGLLEQHRELRAALQRPGVDSESRRRTLVAITEGAGASKLLVALAGVLAARDQLAFLPAIAEAYGAMVNAARGIVPAEVTGAVALSARQETALAEALRATVGAELERTTRVDPQVLGGLRVNMGGRTYDGTVRAQLAALRRRLAGGS